MSWFDRINQKLVRYIHRHRPHPHLEADGFHLVYPNGTEKQLSFARLTRAWAEYRDVFIGDLVVLVLLFDDGTRLEFGQDDPGWWGLMERLDQSGRLNKPSSVWQLEIIAANGNPPVIFLM